MGNKIEKNEMGRACSAYGGRRGVYRVLVEKPEGKRLLGRPRHRWEDSIKMDLQEVGCGGMDWIKLAQDRYGWRALVNAIMNLWVIKLRRMRWAGHVACMGEGRGVCRVLVEKPEGKRLLGRPRRRWMILRWISSKWDVGV